MEEKKFASVFLRRGDTDFLGKIWDEDRFNVLDEEGFDLYGEHLPLIDVEGIISSNHILVIGVGIYDDEPTARKVQKENNDFLYDTMQWGRVAVVEQVEGSDVYAVKIYKV
jgi:hypothetical protein